MHGACIFKCFGLWLPAKLNPRQQSSQSFRSFPVGNRSSLLQTILTPNSLHTDGVDIIFQNVNIFVVREPLCSTAWAWATTPLSVSKALKYTA